MNDFFKKLSKAINYFGLLNTLMAFICILASVTFFVDNNIYAGIWAFNTLMWVVITAINEMTNKDMQERYTKEIDTLSDVYMHNLKKKDAEIDKLKKEIAVLKNQSKNKK